MPKGSQFEAYEKNAAAYDANNDTRQRTMRKKARAVATALSLDFTGSSMWWMMSHPITASKPSADFTSSSAAYC